MPTVSPSARTEIEQRFNAFLRLLDEPYGGKVLFGHYAPEAALSYKFEVIPAAALGIDAFAVGIAAGALMHEETLPPAPRRPVIREAMLLSLADDGPDQRTAWFRANEAETGQSLFIAVGLRRQAQDAWRIGWLTLAPAPQAWTYAQGCVQALADFPFALNAGMGLPRSWLDLAWYRLYGHPRPALSFLPEARFGCDSAAACCTKGFNIDVPAGVQAFVDAIPWAQHAPHLVGTRFEPLEGHRVRLKHSDEDCRFLDEQRHCRIHAIVGRAVFPACTIYPMVFQDTPDGVAVAMSPSCPSARANLGPPLADRQEDLYARLALRRPAAAEAYRLSHDDDPDWPAYKAAEAGLLALLARTDLPLARRLWLGSRWLDLLPATGGVTALDHEPEPQAQDPDGIRLGLLARFASHFGLALPAGNGLVPRALPASVDDVLASTFRNLLHGKVHAASHGLRLAHHVNVLGYMLVRYAAARQGEGELPDALLWQVGAGLMHGSLARALNGQPDLLEVMSDPGFGAWMLGSPQAV